MNNWGSGGQRIRSHDDKVRFGSMAVGPLGCVSFF